MSKTDFDVIIVGAGIAGLVAAQQCEKAGLKTILIEADNHVGGRIQNEIVEGFNLEKGFQVLIDSYEKAQELLDYDLLDLKKFDAGAVVYDQRGSFIISDPLRNFSSLPFTALSRVGTLTDKFKILRLSTELKGTPLDQLFEGKNETTLSYLQKYGFSEQIIENFFRPFFGGIFLERQLSTSAAMFRFVFRNFALGSACIPSKGMMQIAHQLKDKLSNTKVLVKTKVKTIDHQPFVVLEDGQILHSKKLILACNPRPLLKQLDHQLAWKKTTTFYFQGSSSLPSMRKKIGLDARKNSTINNFARHDEVVPECAPKGKSLWSVTSRKDADAESIKRDLAALLDMKSDELQFLKNYEITHALPAVEQPKLSIPAEQTQVTDHIHLAGDYLTNSSIDGAMRAGEAAGRAISETINLLT